MSLAARGGVSAGVLEALSRRLAASEMCGSCHFKKIHADAMAGTGALT
jgi:hypothetical protein